MGSRIQLLDSFRTLAILVVIIYHYFYRWQSILPYDGFRQFEIGKYGVQLFFVISGFVIYYSMLKKESLRDFYLARVVRLLPTMIIFSSITFLFFKLFPIDIHPRFDNGWPDLFSSWVFVGPEVLHYYLGIKTNYVDTAYWSLWYEVRFYFWVGMFYFLSKDKFLRNWMIFTVVLNLWMHFLPMPKPLWSINMAIRNFMPVDWINYFTLGILFFKLYTEKWNPKHVIYLVSVFYMESLRINAGGDKYSFLAFNFIMVIFVLFVLKIPFPRFMNHSLTINIGQSSYGLYLIHQNVGIGAIYLLSLYTPINPVVSAFLTIIILVTLSIVTFKWLEKPMISYLNAKLFRPKNTELT